MASIRKLTKSKQTLYTPTTVGEIEHVDGEYRRTQKLIIGRNKVTEWIYRRLEDVAKTITRAEKKKKDLEEKLKKSSGGKYAKIQKCQLKSVEDELLYLKLLREL